MANAYLKIQKKQNVFQKLRFLPLLKLQ
jgi:hypothetical protein